MSAKGKGGTYHYYSCTGRQRYGSKTCRNERLPSQRLEDAVFAQLAHIYRDTDLIAAALDQAQAEAKAQRPEIEQRLASIRAEIARSEQALERYYEAFEQGTLPAERCQERTTRLHQRLEDLKAQDDELSLQAPDEDAEAPTVDELASVANELERIIAQAKPQQAKAFLRILIVGLRVNGKADIQPTYRAIVPDNTRVAGVCATSRKTERGGFEPPNEVNPRYAISSRARSTAPAPLLGCDADAAP
jgi:site-specific DNA recombinase